MKIIVGLGNPGKKYELTRHNVGFLAVDHFLKDQQTISCQSKFEGTICEVHFHLTRADRAKPDHSRPTKTFFIKPKTFMNNSGKAVLEVCKFYKVDTARDLLVIHDEIDLPFSKIKSTHSSSSAGHNGVQSIIDELGNQDFHRIRVGVDGRSTRADFPTSDYVLSPFSPEEQRMLNDLVFPEVNKQIKEFIEKE